MVMGLTSNQTTKLLNFMEDINKAIQDIEVPEDYFIGNRVAIDIVDKATSKSIAIISVYPEAHKEATIYFKEW